MPKITLTEALAELKTIDKRIDKKRQFILTYVLRQEMMKDPLEKTGGAPAAIAGEQQSANDLLERKIAIRRAIQDAHAAASIAIGGQTRTIADWLVWRRDVAPLRQKILGEIRNLITATRQEAQRKGVQVVSGGETQPKPNDIIVNLNEQELAKQIEALEELLGALDGQLSLRNALLTIDV